MKRKRFLQRVTLVTVVMGLLFGFAGCLEKEAFPQQGHLSEKAPKSAFGLYKIHLTLIDADTKEPLPDLLVKLANNTSTQMTDPDAKDGVTDVKGVVDIIIAATPPVPQEFVLSFADTTESRSFQQADISVYFFNPVFKFFSDDAAKWGRLYQGTAELTLTRELKQIHYE